MHNYNYMYLMFTSAIWLPVFTLCTLTSGNLLYITTAGFTGKYTATYTTINT